MKSKRKPPVPLDSTLWQKIKDSQFTSVEYKAMAARLEKWRRQLRRAARACGVNPLTLKVRSELN